MNINSVFNTIIGMLIGVVVLSVMVGLTTTLYVRKTPGDDKSLQAAKGNSRLQNTKIVKKIMPLVRQVLRILTMPISIPFSRKAKTITVAAESEPDPVRASSGTGDTHKSGSSAVSPGESTQVKDSIPPIREVSIPEASFAVTPTMESPNRTEPEVGFDATPVEDPATVQDESVMLEDPDTRVITQEIENPQEALASQPANAVPDATTEPAKNEGEDVPETEPEKEKGSMLDIFTNVAIEESDVSKFAAKLDNVNITDLKRETQDLLSQFGGQRK